MMKIIGVDNFARETVADRHLISFPDRELEKAKAFCEWLNSFSCDDVSGGTYYKTVANNYRLSRGMEDLA